MIAKADQVPGKGKSLHTLESGERVILDHGLTVRRVYSIFYWCTNVGSLSGLASVTMEKYLGFWTSFLMSLCSLGLGTFILLLGRKRLCQFNVFPNPLIIIASLDAVQIF